MSSILTRLLEKGLPTRDVQIATTGEQQQRPLKFEGAQEGNFYNGDLLVVGGQDSQGFARHFNLDANGRVIINGQAATNGTVTPVVIQGQYPEGSSSSTNPVLFAGRYDAAPRTLADGQLGAVALNSEGKMMIDLQNASLTATVNVDIDQSTDSIQLYANDGTANRAVKSDSDGRLITTGGVQDSTAIAGASMQVSGGVDSTGVAHYTLTNPLGMQNVSSQFKHGDAQTGDVWPVLIGGVDENGNTQQVTLNQHGNIMVTGPADEGEYSWPKPLLMGGTDGTYMTKLLTDGNGRQIHVGGAPNGVAVAGNPVLNAGSDGTLTRTLKTDTSGRQLVVGAVAAMAAVAGNPVLIGASTDTGAAAYARSDNNGYLYANARGQDDFGSSHALRQDNNGNLLTAGALAAESDIADVAANPVLIGGIDGTVVRYVKVNTDGATVIAGYAANGDALSGNPVLNAGSDGSVVRTLYTDEVGRQIMVGAVASNGAADGSNPVLTAGSDGTFVHSIKVDASGRTAIVGAVGAGQAVAGNPVLMGGSDGTYTRSASTDDTGRFRIVGGAATDSMFMDSGNPVMVGTRGLDNNVHCLLSDGSGRAIIVGHASDGNAPTGNPVMVSGYDGTSTRSLKTDTSGRVQIIGAAAEGASAAGNPALVSGRYDSSDRTLTNGTIGALAMESDAKLKVSLYGTDGSSKRNIKLDSQGVLLTRNLPDYTFYMHGEASGTGAQLILTPNSGVYTPATFRSQGGAQWPNYFVFVSSDNGNMYGMGGLQQITIEGFRTSGGVFISETINLNGTTPVTTANAYNAILRVISTYGTIIPGSTVTARPDDYNTTLSYLEITDTDVYNPIFYSVNALSYCTHISISTDTPSTFSMWRVNCDNESRSVCWRRKFHDVYDYEMDFGPTGAFKVYNNEYIIVMNEGASNANTNFSIRFDSYKI